MKPIFRIMIAFSVLAPLMLTAAPPKKVAAHPLGNFTINQFTALTVAVDRVDVRYIVDMAEIPTHQELGNIRDDFSTDLTPEQRTAFVTKKEAELMPGLALLIDGRPVDMKSLGKPALSFPPGAGGLPTLRLEFSLVAPLESSQSGAASGSLAYSSSNFSDRIGWREIIARPAPGVTLSNSTVPTTDISGELRKYPVDLLSNPLRVTSATLSFATGSGPGSAATSAGVTQSQTGAQQDNGWGSLTWIREQTDAISAIMKQKDLPLGALFIALALAFAIGAAHALAPGHGKTVVAAYLVGSRGTALHAIFLGLAVTLSHTIGVFLLGFVVLYLANYILPEALFPWLNFLSGTLLALMGVSLFVQRWRAWKRGQLPESQAASASGGDALSHGGHSHGDGHTHDHSQDDHDHDHNHSHSEASTPHKHGPFGRAHSHLPADGQKVTMGNLLVLGITGGILPCPSALVVLLVAVASGQIALGMLLILAFSLGLAVVLSGIGLAMVYGRGLLSRFSFGGNRFRWVLGRLPMLSALGVAVLGFLIALRAFSV